MNMELIRKIVRGNDFYLRIPLRRIADGTRVPFPILSSNNVAVSLVNQYRRYLLDRKTDPSDSSVILARVEGEQIPCGRYALEVKGKLLGDDWRTAECGVIEIVEWNALANADYGDIVDGAIVEMGALTVGTASSVLNPKGEWTEGTTYNKGDVVSHDGCCWYANNETTDEPSKDSSAWTLLIDNSGVNDTVEALRDMEATYEDGYLTLNWPKL